LFINGEWIPSESGETYQRVNPANPEEVLGEFQKGNAEDSKKGIEAAQSAFDYWSELPAPKRARYLLKVGDLLTEYQEDLATIMTREMGKTLVDSRADVQEAIDIAYYVSAEGTRPMGYTVPSEKPDKFAMTVRLPIGVAGLISPWNFPIAIPARKIFYALVSGDTAVLKPASDTPICATKLVELIEKAGIPKGVINLITGPGETAGMTIVKDKRVRVVSFTGSRDTGTTIMREAGIKRINLELGGKNPIIVMDDADLNLAAEGALWGGFETSGQRCTAASRVIVHEKVKEPLERLLLKGVRRLRLGNGLDPETDVGPLINKAAQAKVTNYVEVGRTEGAKIMAGGHVPANLKGWFFEPTLLSDCTRDMRISREEIFGPVVSVLPAENFGDAIDIANSVDYGLSSAVYTKSLRNVFVGIRKLQAGLTYVNCSTIGAEVQLPFGGMKQSGNTREDGPEGVKEFTELKTVYIDYSGKLQKTFRD
jgi:aldehyde dehydrogenase (NAD+)